jgi:hypothetical protein
MRAEPVCVSVGHLCTPTSAADAVTTPHHTFLQQIMVHSRCKASTVESKLVECPAQRSRARSYA